MSMQWLSEGARTGWRNTEKESNEHHQCIIHHQSSYNKLHHLNTIHGASGPHYQRN